MPANACLHLNEIRFVSETLCERIYTATEDEVKYANRYTRCTLGWHVIGTCKSINQNYIVMLRWTLTFLVIAVIAAIFGFTGIAAGAASIAKIIFYIFLVFLVISLIAGAFRRTD